MWKEGVECGKKKEWSGERRRSGVGKEEGVEWGKKKEWNGERRRSGVGSHLTLSNPLLPARPAI